MRVVFVCVCEHVRACAYIIATAIHPPGKLYYFDDDDENDAIRAPSTKNSVRITVVV